MNYKTIVENKKIYILSTANKFKNKLNYMFIYVSENEKILLTFSNSKTTEQHINLAKILYELKLTIDLTEDISTQIETYIQ